MLRFAALAVPLCCSLGWVAPLPAQERSDSVPREFAELFIVGSPGTEGLWVGRIPDPLLGRVPFPEGLRVVGGVGRNTFLSTVIFATEESPERVLDGYRELLEASGWSRAESRGPRSGGFVDSRSAASEFWCGPAFGVGPSVVTAEGTSYLRLMVGQRERTLCGAPAPLPSRMGIPGVPTLPDLTAPPGVQQRGGGQGSGSDHAESAAHLETSLPPATLLHHYVPQMVEAGWTPAGSPVEGDPASARFTLEQEGRRWTAILLVYGVGEGSLRALLRADARDDPGWR